MVTIIVSTILILSVLLLFLSFFALTWAFCHTSATFFSDRKPPSCATQNWAFGYRQLNSLATGYRVLQIYASLTGKLVKVMCRAPSGLRTQIYIPEMISVPFQHSAPNSIILHSAWQKSRQTSTTLFCDQCNLNHRWINKNVTKYVV